MQNTYFLGGASPDGFETDFWNEQRSSYGFLLKGGPGTGKSTLMKRIAAAFPDEPVSVYHCASDPHSLDAVVLEQRGVYVVDATAPHAADPPLPHVTGAVTDLGAGLDRAALRDSADAVRMLYAANQAAHVQARKGLAGIAAMEDQITEIGERVLLREKLTQYAARLAGRILPKGAGKGRILERQRIALTPAGRVCFLPADCDLMLLDDPAQTAAGVLLTVLTSEAVSRGLTAEVTRSLTRRDRAPELLVLPELSLVIAAGYALPEDTVQVPVSLMHMRRFYGTGLRAQRTLLRFCVRTKQAASAQTAALLSEALRIHDELEAHYIRALNPDFLNRTAEELIRQIQMLP
ncbi:MAG: hypothetical protein J5722_02325 [Oscillospiraceae bacterium]|nr:hypothetical protein [Oscillospiraceae bacterium]